MVPAWSLNVGWVARVGSDRGWADLKEQVPRGTYHAAGWHQADRANKTLAVHVAGVVARVANANSRNLHTHLN